MGCAKRIDEPREAFGPTRPFSAGGDARARLLVVDDENGPRQALRMLLNEEYHVSLASNVAEGLEVLSREPVDVVITDIRMPDQSGVDLLCEVKRLYPDIQVIMLTGYGQLDTAMKAVELGAFAYLEKPFDNEDMLEKVRACVEKRKAEHDRRAMEYLAIEANRFETLGRLVSGTMHDLGTPLSILGTHLELIMCDPEQSNIQNRLATMQSQLHHCNDLVRTTMNFLRQSPQSQEPFNLNDVVHLCFEVARPVLSKQRIDAKLELSNSISPCRGDLVLVRQAVLNLIYNACQAMEDQEVPQQLSLETWGDGEHVYLSVQDSGPGVPEEDTANIFDALFSTKGNRGTGLGLTVVRNVMQRHNGDVQLERPEGGGARFVLKFPIL